MATSGFGQLGAALTGGGVLPATIAEAQGEQLGANTQNAIAEAQLRQQKFQGRQAFGQNAAALAAGSKDSNALGQALTASAQGEIPIDMLLKGVHQQYENNSYNTITNPDTPDDIVARHLAAEGKEGGIIRPTAAGEAQTNILHPELGTTTTPLGQALIPAKVNAANAAANASNANAHLHDAQATNGGLKPPSGYQWANNDDGTPALDDNGQRKVTPLTGGSKDPDAPHAMGANQTAQFLRVINAARQGVADLGNVMDMPVGASTGWFGSGIAGSQGHSLGGTMAANLSNALNGNDVQRYNTVMSGLNQNLSALETFGLAPRGSLVGSMDRLAITPTDTEETALTKLAQGRQIIEQALNTHVLDNPNLSESQKGPLRDLITQIQSSIPFTVQDINKLHNAKGGDTLGVMSSRHFGGAPPSGPAAAPAPAPRGAPAQVPTGYPGNAIPTFDSEAEAEAAGLKSGTPVIIGGRKGTWTEQ